MTTDTTGESPDVPTPPEQEAHKPKSQGLRHYVRSLEGQRNDLARRVADLETELAGARLDTVLAEMRVPEAFRAVARQRGTAPTTEAVEALMAQVRAEADHASRVLAQYDAGADEQGADALPEVDGYTPEEVQAAVSAAVSAALAAQGVYDGGADD
ncbi:hypothetical protein [Terrabacter terrigena]|uniref:Uncharacterized protein n=1 Tax=Terrabacter terrigena TaxID=574718 RepID=A0ABW3MXE4_9MICO